MDSMVIPEPIHRQSILGVRVSAVHMTQALVAIEEWIEQRKKTYVCVVPAHSIMDCYQDPELRSMFNQSGLTTPDGMAIVWLLKLYGYRQVNRVYGPDLMMALCERSLVSGWRHFFYGGTLEVVQRLIQVLQQRFPALQVSGFYCPPFRDLSPEEDEGIVEQINKTGSDVVWVGIGSPRQERWMFEHRDRLEAPVLAGVGAAFDFISGSKRQAPVWMQRSGLEWLFRLSQEPGRLWPRYRQYPKFLVLAVAQLLRFVRFSED